MVLTINHYFTVYVLVADLLIYLINYISTNGNNLLHFKSKMTHGVFSE